MSTVRALPRILLLTAAALAAGCATNPVTGEQDFVLMSEERELNLGAEFHKQILKQYEIYDDDALQAYVNRIGQRLAQKSHRPDVAYQFTVLDDDSVNAFALPGGYIYITRGILAYFNSEAELAGVLGHEIGHVTARHSVQQYSTATATSILGSIVLSQTGGGRAAGQLFQTVQLAALRGYGREHELEADRLGAEYLARGGYQSDKMLGVVRLLADQEQFEIARAEAEGREPRVYHGVFSTHPDNDARRQEVIGAARQFELDKPRPDGHEEYLGYLEGMPFGPSADQGVVDAHEFLHLPLDAGLRAPEDWTIDNKPKELIFKAPDVDAGLIVTLEEAVRHSNPQKLLRDQYGELEEGQSLQIGDYRGYTGVQLRQTVAGARRVRFALVIKEDQAWYFRATAPDPKTFERLDGDFLSIVRSLHALTPAERERARPLRIELVRAEAGTTYEQLAADSPRLADPVGRLRRVRFGPLRLEGVESGKWRPLRAGDVVRVADLRFRFEIG